MRYSVSLLKKEKINENTLSLRFEKPSGFVFKPGQFIQLSLPDDKYSDDKGNMRDISIASAPHEKHLLFVVRLRDSSFKKGLESMLDGENVVIKGPLGPFVLPDPVRMPVVFIAGGIGITPFRSMLMDTKFTKKYMSSILFYMVRNIRDALFLDDLQNIQKIGNHKVIISVTRDFHNWGGERGRITKYLVSQHVSKPTKSVFYIAGSFEMVRSMEVMLEEMGVTRDRIMIDYFTGYER